MAQAILPISSELFAELFKAGPPRTYRIISGGLPDDVALVSILFDGRTIYAVFESATFDPGEDDGSVRQLQPIIATVEPIPPPNWRYTNGH